MNIFRITRAEFAKVFKKPTVYIMAFILALVLVITLFSYNPTLRQTKTVSIEGDNALTVYSIFYGDSSTYDNKSKIDKDYFNATNNQISFYNDLYVRSNNLSEAYKLLNTNYVNLVNAYSENTKNSNLDQLMSKTKESFNDLLNCYGDISVYIKYQGLNNIINSKNINGKAYFENKYFDVIEKGTAYNFETLKNKYIPELNADNTIKSFIDYIKTNKYLDIMQNMTDYGSNLIYNILSDVLTDISTIQNEFIQLVGGDKSTANKELMNIKVSSLNDKVSEFKTLVEGLVNNEAIYAIHTKTDYEKLTNACDAFKLIYDDIKVNDSSDYSSKKNGAIALRNSSYLTTFQDYLNSLSFIELNTDFNKTLAEYSKLVQTNQETILKDIEENKKDISTGAMIENITNYMLLGETYQEIVNCEVINQLSKNLPLSKTQDAKNIDLTRFNEYDNKNKITSLKFQLTENIYYNEVGGIFSLNQTMSTEKNMYDFTYYALKIATMLIIIFTIMMIANLITSETDSGTIKLLLIRPYKRGTVLFGKILATFFFSLSFLLLSFVISMVAGYFMFGLPSIESVLVTFNASKTFLIKPLYLILLFFVSCAGDILFYLIIALTISVLFKSYIGAISTSLIVYVGSMVVGSFLSNSIVYAYLPFTNISWFRFFGGEIMGTESGIGALLSSPVHSFQNIYLSIGISTIFSLVLFIITFISFKRRDF